MQFPASACFLLICSATGAWAQTEGAITGKVVDSGGKPVASVAVDISEKGKALRGHRLRGQAWTGADGTFRIQHVPLGTYIVETSKSEDGYPDTALAFYSNLKIPTVSVSPIVPDQEVTIVLEPKAGILDASDVVDAITGAPIQATVKLRRVDSGYWMSTSSTVNNILVAPDTAVAIEVSAPGYATWYYPGSTDASRSATISLKPEQKMTISVALQPLPK
jgi:Carboxypeptidase regulatory-like domain